jgi:general secretion pathway protein I
LCRAPFFKEGQRGFTLIESVVVLALVTIMLTAIGRLVAATTTGTRTLEGHVALVETARLVLTAIPRRRELGAEDLAGEIAGHRWQVRQSPIGDDDLIRGSIWIPQNIAVRVQSPSGAVFTLETVRLVRRPGT